MPKQLNKHDGERRIALVEIFEGKAQWRRQKAVEHPDDKRNLEAATILDRLAKSVDSVPPTTLNSFFELYEDYEGEELIEELRRQASAPPLFLYPMVLLHEQKLSHDTGHARALQGQEPGGVGRCVGKGDYVTWDHLGGVSAI